jgi:hypothetical protein
MQNELIYINIDGKSINLLDIAFLLKSIKYSSKSELNIKSLSINKLNLKSYKYYSIYLDCRKYSFYTIETYYSDTLIIVFNEYFSYFNYIYYFYSNVNFIDNLPINLINNDIFIIKYKWYYLFKYLQPILDNIFKNYNGNIIFTGYGNGINIAFIVSLYYYHIILNPIKIIGFSIPNINKDLINYCNKYIECIIINNKPCDLFNKLIVLNTKNKIDNYIKNIKYLLKNYEIINKYELY